MNFSIVTAVFNRVEYIGDAVRSVRMQEGVAVQHVVVDGGSTDGTLDVLGRVLAQDAVLLSEPDNGIYDALNKGLALAQGEVIGLMHSDDFYADERVLSEVAEAFRDPQVDAVYGDLDYVAKADTSRIVRHWKAGAYHPGALARGWMPPHPTLFVRRHVVDLWGGFDPRFRISGDYDAVLRYFSKGGIHAAYVPRVLVKMRVGGESNRSVQRILAKSREDYVAIRRNNVGGMTTLVWKNLSKVSQFWAR